MDLKTKEQLAFLLGDSQRTYAEICRAMPALSDIEFKGAVTSPIDNMLQQVNPRPRNRDEEYRPQPDDIFTLSENGRDILYLAQRHRRTERMQQAAVVWAAIAAVAAIISIASTYCLAR